MSDKEEIRELIRKNYEGVALKGSQGCGCSCDCQQGGLTLKEISLSIGYSENDLDDIPEHANMGLGCGNPIAIAALKEGEIVLDLGSGGGFDCFLARKKVGDTGYVIGVDMTPEMIKLSRKNAEDSGYTNMEFRLGEIEHLPLADSSVDVIISNCVINLSLEKEKVFKEAYRVLKPGGRISVSDIVAIAELSENIKQDLSMTAGCIAGAEFVDNIKRMLEDAGFINIKMFPRDNSKEIVSSWVKNIDDYVASYIIEAQKDLIHLNIKTGGTFMKTLKIEWRHLDVDGETCDRCYDTGENLANEVKRLTKKLQPKGIKVEFSEIKLDNAQIPQSNTILFNGVPIEEILDIKVSQNFCESCSALVGTDTYCRTVVFEDNEYEDIPAKAIRQAAYKAAGIKEEKSKPSGNSCCGGKGCC